jgi:Putative transposase
VKVRKPRRRFRAAALWSRPVPKRLRWYVEREPKALSAVLHIFLRVIERHLQQTSPGAGPGARFGAVSFVHRFDASLNRHVHFHCCVIDGMFECGPVGEVQFRPAQALTPEALAAGAVQVRRRVLRWFALRGLLEAVDVKSMLGWEHGGFSLDAAVRIAGDDRAGLKRLLRYCARPAFALERLTGLPPATSPRRPVMSNAERPLFKMLMDSCRSLCIATHIDPEQPVRAGTASVCWSPCTDGQAVTLSWRERQLVVQGSASAPGHAEPLLTRPQTVRCTDTVTCETV